MDRWLVGAGLIAGLLVLLIVAIGAYMAHAITRPRPRAHAPGSAIGTQIEDVRFRAADGVALHGWYFGHPAPKAALALCHGFGMPRDHLLDLARALRDRGYAILLFDFRAHGGSAGRRSTIGYHEVRDVVAAARYLAQRAELAGCRIGALGMSMGASAALMGTAQEPLIAAVVADSGFATLGSIVNGGLRLLYRLPPFPFAPLIVTFGQVLVGARISRNRPIDYVAQIAPRPVLLIHGTRDRLIPFGDSEALYAAAGQPKELWLVPEIGHVQAQGTYADEYLTRVDRFFTAALVAATPLPVAQPVGERSRAMAR